MKLKVRNRISFSVITILIFISCSQMIGIVSAAPAPSNSEDKDSDGDLIPDHIEILYTKTDPNNRDTDEDGMWDGYEVIASEYGSWQDPLVKNQRYAILFVGGAKKNDNHARYWNQLIFMYDTLVHGYSYDPEHVVVFYADGNTPNKDNMHASGLRNIIPETLETHADIIDLDASKETLVKFLKFGKKVCTKRDSLFFWVYDHGFDSAPNAGINCWESEILDWRLHDLLKGYKLAQSIFVLGTCYSGGFLDPSKNTGVSAPRDYNWRRNLNDLKGNVIIMTSQDFRVSFSGTRKGFLYRFREGITPYGIYAFPGYPYPIIRIVISSLDLMLNSAMYDNGHYTGVSPDSDENGFISMREIFLYAEANDDYSATNGNGATIPQYYESSPGLGAKTYL